jgi:hypothetical protein
MSMTTTSGRSLGNGDASSPSAASPTTAMPALLEVSRRTPRRSELSSAMRILMPPPPSAPIMPDAVRRAAPLRTQRPRRRARQGVWLGPARRRAPAPARRGPRTSRRRRPSVNTGPGSTFVQRPPVSTRTPAAPSVTSAQAPAVRPAWGCRMRPPPPGSAQHLHSSTALRERHAAARAGVRPAGQPPGRPATGGGRAERADRLGEVPADWLPSSQRSRGAPGPPAAQLGARERLADPSRRRRRPSGR